MKVICAWCEKTLKEGTGEVSHGICQDCLDKQKLELLKYKSPAVGRVTTGQGL